MQAPYRIPFSGAAPPLGVTSSPDLRGGSVLSTVASSVLASTASSTWSLPRFRNPPHAASRSASSSPPLPKSPSRAGAAASVRRAGHLVARGGLRSKLDGTYGSVSGAAAGGRRRGPDRRRGGKGGRGAGRDGVVAGATAGAGVGVGGAALPTDAADLDLLGGPRRRAADIMDRLLKGERRGGRPVAAPVHTESGTSERARAVVQKHGYLCEQDVEQLSQSSGYSRRELYRVFGLYKALCSISADASTIDPDTLRRGVPMLTVEDDLFVRRVFSVLDGNSNAHVEWEEFLKLMAALEKGPRERRAELLFMVYDEAGDGRISERTFYQFFIASLGVEVNAYIEEVSRYFVRRLFTEIEGEGATHLTLPGILRYLAAHPEVHNVFALFGRSMTDEDVVESDLEDQEPSAAAAQLFARIEERARRHREEEGAPKSPPSKAQAAVLTGLTELGAAVTPPLSTPLSPPPTLTAPPVAPVVDPEPTPAAAASTALVPELAAPAPETT